MPKSIVMLFTILFSFILPFSCLAVTVENPRADLYVSPGSNAEAKFNVINRSNHAQTMKVSQSDYTFKADGSNEFAQPGTIARSNAKWIKFSPESFTIKPNTTIEIVLQIHVPNQKMTGTYWSMLMVEYVDQNSLNTAKTTDDLNSGVQVIRRQGVQVRTHITGTGEKKARFLNKNIVKKNGKTFFEIDLENTGTLFYRGDFWVELFNQEGYPIGKVEQPMRGVYPDCSIRYSVDISQFKKGNYTALCVYDTRSNKVFGGKYQVEIN